MDCYNFFFCFLWKKEIENNSLICRLTTFVVRQLNMLSCILRLQIVKTSSFCLFNLLGLVKCLAEFLLRLSVKDW